MTGKRLLSVLLAALLMLQSAVGLALHRCDHHALATWQGSTRNTQQANSTHHCDQATATNAAAPNPASRAPHSADLRVDNAHFNPAHGNAESHHGNCTCAIAHCTPGISPQFDFAITPAHTPFAMTYRFASLTAEPDNQLRPPIPVA